MVPDMSRTRLIRPEFFADETMAAASIPTRLVYIGLWTLCDDAGYFDRKPRQIAAALFPYDGQVRRQRIVDKALAELVEMCRVRYLDCGVHAVVPTLPRHGAKGGTKSETYLSRHVTVCDGQTARGHNNGLPPGKGVSTAVKEAVTARDREMCRYCGTGGIAGATLVFEHVDNFGPGTYDNVVLACRSCNRRKASGTPEAAGMTLLPEAVRTQEYGVRLPTDKSSSVSVSGLGSDSVSDSVSEGAQARKTLRDIAAEAGGYVATLARRPA